MTSSISSTLPSRPSKVVRRDLSPLFASGSYYEALQLYKSMIHRATTKKDFDTAAEIAQEGAKLLLEHQQGNAGAELAIALIEAWNKAAFTVTADRIAVILSLFYTFPPESSNAAESFMKAALKWSRQQQQTASQQNPSDGQTAVIPIHAHPDLHLAFARYHLIRSSSNKESQTQNDSDRLDHYNHSHLHYLRATGATIVNAKKGPITTLIAAFKQPPTCLTTLTSSSSTSTTITEYDTYAEHAALLYQWSDLVYPSELDLFITRSILQYLALGDLKGANSLLDHFMTSLPSQQSSLLAATPLLHFCQFLLRCCERDATPLFDVLRAKYHLALSRDTDLAKYLEKIGTIFFHKPAQKNMLDSLFS